MIPEPRPQAPLVFLRLYDGPRMVAEGCAEIATAGPAFELAKESRGDALGYSECWVRADRAIRYNIITSEVRGLHSGVDGWEVVIRLLEKPRSLDAGEADGMASIHTADPEVRDCFIPDYGGRSEADSRRGGPVPGWKWRRDSIARAA
jgi:hypothetical protein